MNVIEKCEHTMCFAAGILAFVGARHPDTIATTICKGEMSYWAHWLGVAAPRGGRQACEQTRGRREILPPLLVVSYCLSLGRGPKVWLRRLAPCAGHVLMVSILIQPCPGPGVCLLRKGTLTVCKSYSTNSTVSRGYSTVYSVHNKACTVQHTVPS